MGCGVLPYADIALCRLYGVNYFALCCLYIVISSTSSDTAILHAQCCHALHTGLAHV